MAYTNYVSSLSTLFKSAIEKLGITSIKGFNSGSLLGNSYCTSTLSPSDQTRSTSTAYIDSALDLSNLKVYTQTLAQKVIFNGNKTATGVQVSSLGIDYTIHAAKEVILSAGAFQSPQLLMVSGVGPSDTLSGLGINVVSDLPGVGQNMWDHILFGPTYQVNIDTLSSVLKNPVNLAAAVLEYATNATGPLTSPVADFIGWEKLPAEYRVNFSQSTVDDLAQFPSDWPEVEVRSNIPPFPAQRISLTKVQKACRRKRLSRQFLLPPPRPIHARPPRPKLRLLRRRLNRPNLTRQHNHKLHLHLFSPTHKPELANHQNRPRGSHSSLPPTARHR